MRSMRCGVLADQDAPALGLDAVEDDLRGLGGRGRRLLEEAPRALVGELADVGVLTASRRRGPSRRLRGAHLGDAPWRVRSSDSLPLWILRELATIEVPMWPGMTTEHLMCGAFRREVGDQRLGEALHRELGGAVGGVRHAGAERRPEAVDAAGVDDVAVVGLQQHRQEGAGAVVDAAPADVEGPLPLLAARARSCCRRRRCRRC